MAGIFGAPLAAVRTALDPREIQAANAAAGAMRQNMTQQMPEMQMPQYVAPKRTLSDKLGLLSDAFMGSNRHTQMLLAREGQDREQWAAQQAALLKRAQDFADWERKERWKLDNPSPEAKPNIQREVEYFNSIGRPDLAKAAMENEANPLRWITASNPDGTQTIIPVGPNGPLTGGGAPAPQQTLPPDFFDNGGASPSGSRPFR